MGNWIIFVVGLLINQLVNVTKHYTHILKHYFPQMNAVKVGKSMLQRCTLKQTLDFSLISFNKSYTYFTSRLHQDALIHVIVSTKIRFLAVTHFSQLEHTDTKKVKQRF